MIAHGAFMRGIGSLYINYESHHIILGNLNLKRSRLLETISRATFGNKEKGQHRKFKFAMIVGLESYLFMKLAVNPIFIRRSSVMIFPSIFLHVNLRFSMHTLGEWKVVEENYSMKSFRDQ